MFSVPLAGVLLVYVFANVTMIFQSDWNYMLIELVAKNGILIVEFNQRQDTAY